MPFLRLSIRNPLPRISSLCIFVTIYVCLFAVAAVILFGSFSRIYSERDVDSPKNYKTGHMRSRDNAEQKRYFSRFYSSHALVVNHQWQKELISYEKRPVNDAKSTSLLSLRSVLELYWPHSNSLLNCTSLQEVTDFEFISAGWTKAVYKGVYRGQHVAVKTLNHNGRDIEECQKKSDMSLPACYQRAEAKIIREIVLLTELAHENVVKILGFCVPDAIGSATLITELGEPLDTVRLLQISWEDRLRLVLGLAHILHHLAFSPLGSLSMNDFRRQQFVLVDGQLKLTDVDDVGIGEPDCDDDDICRNLSGKFASRLNSDVENSALHVPLCLNFHCVGHNSRLNIWQAGQHFVKHLLPVSAPELLQPHVQELLDAYEFKQKKHSDWDTSKILETTLNIVDHYKSGKYINSTVGVNELGLKKIEDSDLPGMFDYRCRHSISSVSCVMSVFHEEEAAEFCLKDTDCKAVVLSTQQTWTGRTIAIFKNGYSSPRPREGFTLLVKNIL